MATQTRPPPEYIEKLEALHTVWSRNNEEANKLVFVDLDIIFNKYIEEAYKNFHFEAFAHLTRLKEHINTGFANKLSVELDYVKKLPQLP